MSGQRLAVFVNRKRVGCVVNEGGEYVFAYENPDQLDPLCDLVSLTMPVRAKSYETQVLMPPFQTNLPEGALLEQLRKRFGKIMDTYNDLNLLQLVGQHMIGRVRFGAASREEDLAPSDERVLRSLLRDQSTHALFDELMARYAAHSGVSGVQPKFLWGEMEGKLSLTTEGYIVKSSGRDYPGLAVNEYFCLSAARQAGLPVPEATLSANGEILVVKRFDQSQECILAFEEFCALLQYPNHGKYMASYEQLAEAIGQIPCRPVAHALKHYFVSVVLTMALQNGDAHLKNYAVLYERADQVVMAPFYDLVTTTAYLKHDVPALSLGGAKQWPLREDLVHFGVSACSLKRSRASELVDSVLLAIEQTLPRLQAYGSKYPRYAGLTETLSCIWQSGVQRYRA
jgi:serine/threonine-protein kinase HipA